MNSIQANIRNNSTKGQLNEIRNSGNVPGIIYGGKDQNQKISISKKLLKGLIEKENFLSSILTLNVDGKNQNVLPREVKYHILSDEPTHVDFLRVLPGVKIKIEVPVNFINHEKSPGLKRGGVLNIVRRKVELKCPSEKIPENLTIDLDGVDQDCNGFETCYQDSDGDGYGSGMISSTTISCIGPGVSLQDGDCNDGDINIYPWASEDSSDPADQNCDGMEASGYVTCDSSEDAGVYYLFCADLTTWDSADNDCAAHGYDGLSSVLSSTENDFLIANLPDSTEMWIGYSDQSAEGTFEWSDGSVMGSYTAPWGSGEPNDTGGSEDCAALNSSVHTLGEWDDFDCSSTFTFVCASR